MATVKSEYYRLNGSTWDLYFFKTSADLVAETADYKVLTAAERTKITDNLTDFNVANKLAKLGADAKLPSTIIPALGYLPTAGGALTGDQRKITNVLAIRGGDSDSSGLVLFGNTTSLQAGNENILTVIRDTQTGAKTISANSYRITDLASPMSGSDAASKAWVETMIAQGTHVVGAVRVASTVGQAPRVGLVTIDGIALADGDRVLLKNQTTATENGVYIVRATSWTKIANDSDKGSLTVVLEGTTNKGKQFYNRTGTTWELFDIQKSYHATINGGLELDSTGFGFKIKETGGGGIVDSMVSEQAVIGAHKIRFKDIVPEDIGVGGYYDWDEIDPGMRQNTTNLDELRNLIVASFVKIRGTDTLGDNNTQSISDAYNKIRLKNKIAAGSTVPSTPAGYDNGDVYLKILSST